jgi:hypothetical protein
MIRSPIIFTTRVCDYAFFHPSVTPLVKWPRTGRGNMDASGHCRRRCDGGNIDVSIPGLAWHVVYDETTWPSDVEMLESRDEQAMIWRTVFLLSLLYISYLGHHTATIAAMRIKLMRKLDRRRLSMLFMWILCIIYLFLVNTQISNESNFKRRQ